jgi:hypothetical protein
LNPDTFAAGWTPAAVLDGRRLDARFYGPEHVALLTRLRESPISGGPLKSLTTHIAHVTGYESVKHMEFIDEPSGVKVVEANNVGDVLIDGSAWKLISKTGYVSLPRHQLQEGDIVFTKDGTLGNCALVTNDILPAVASRHVFRIVPRRDRVDPAYLALWLSSSAGRIQTAHRQAGAVQGTIITPEVASFHVLVPSHEIQQAIGAQVRLAAHLRNLGWAIWNKATRAMESKLGVRLATEMFANISPDSVADPGVTCVSTAPPIVFAAVNGVLSAQYYHPRRIHAQAVAETSGKWDALCQLAPRMSERKHSTAREFVGLDRVDSLTGIVSGSGHESAGDAAGAEFRTGDIVFSRLRPYLNKVAIWPSHLDRSTGSGEFLVYRPNDKIDPHYLFFVLKSPLGLYQVVDVTSGSTHPRVDAELVDQIRIPRLAGDAERAVGASVATALRHMYEAQALIATAKTEVEALIDGLLDTPQLLADGAAAQARLPTEGDRK